MTIRNKSRDIIPIYIVIKNFKKHSLHILMNPYTNNKPPKRRIKRKGDLQNSDLNKN